MPTDSLAAIRELLADRLKFIEHLLMIEDKSRRPVHFHLNDIQRELYPKIAPRGTRAVILKPSQVGASSLIIADFFVETITTPGTTSVIIAYEDFITQRLLKKAQSYYDNLPEEFRPKISHKSSNEMYFPDLNSVFYIGSARSYVFGRGEAIHNLLCDEYAFWQDPEKIMVPILQRVPEQGRLLVLSTPNGEDNAFCELYGVGKSQTSRWRSYFFPWYTHKEYQLPPGSASACESDKGALSDLMPDEQALLVLGLSEAQLRWRRAKQSELEALRKDGATRLLFWQEYPEDDVSCFMVTGNAAYDATTLDTLAKGCFPAQYGYDHAQVWELPKEGFRYVLAVDPGQGKATRSAITVWRFVPDLATGHSCPVHCATSANFYPPEETAEKAASLGTYYNRALIAVEANAHGLAVISELRNTQKYTNLYLRRDIVDGLVSHQIGWLTTPRTKPFMVKELSKVLGVLTCHDSQIISELRGIRLVRASNGAYITMSLGLEDLHMSAGIAICCQGALPQTYGFAGQGGWTEDWGQIHRQ